MSTRSVRELTWNKKVYISTGLHRYSMEQHTNMKLLSTKFVLLCRFFSLPCEYSTGKAGSL